MLRNSAGVLIANEEAVFPLITFDNRTGFHCLGTGFFINDHGGFLTAKHVVMETDGTFVPRLFGVQTLANGTRIVRTMSYIDCHPHADIAHGSLGNVFANGAYSAAPLAETLPITLDALNIGDVVNTYGYPIQDIANAHMDTVTITFQGISSEGNILEYCPEGSLRTRNVCYATSLVTDYGHSGGPVIRCNNVIGVNSSSFQGSTPSYFTPLSFIADLRARDGDGTYRTFREVFARQQG